MGSALGLAAITALSVAFGADGIGNPAEITDGFRAGFLGAAGVAFLGALVAASFIRKPPAAGVEEVQAAEPELAHAA